MLGNHMFYHLELDIGNGDMQWEVQKEECVVGARTESVERWRIFHYNICSYILPLSQVFNGWILLTYLISSINQHSN